jgi:hypothetical protein
MAEIEKVDYWRWTESNWRNPDIKDVTGCLLTAGVDIGSTSTQAVVMADGVPFVYSNMRTGNNSPDSAINAMNWALKDTGLTFEDIEYTIGTGYGRVNVPFSNKNITEITCHARGANYIYGPLSAPSWTWRSGLQGYPLRREGRCYILHDERQVRRRHRPRHGSHRQPPRGPR